jgi:RHS repeat-associated protein
LFTAAERDAESGLDYMSARHYSSDDGTFRSRDPLFEKYFWISPYCYTLNNPVKLIDPTGMGPEDGATKWKTINPVISKSDFVPYEKRNCFDLAQDQMAKVNTKAGGVIYQLYTEKNGAANKEKVSNAVKYIQKMLDVGNPVFIGVDNQPDNQKDKHNNDNTTDHFVVIVGMGNDKKGNYFRFYDSATGDSDAGTSSGNKLYYNEKKGIIQGKSQTPYGRSWSDPDLGTQEPYTDGYIVTQIRKTETKTEEIQ